MPSLMSSNSQTRRSPASGAACLSVSSFSDERPSNHPAVFLQQRQGNGLADALARAGHDRGLETAILGHCSILHIGRLSFVMRPPSMVQTWPVTNDASSEASHATNAATSSGRPVRPIGWMVPSFFRKFTGSGMFSM